MTTLSHLLNAIALIGLAWMATEPAPATEPVKAEWSCHAVVAIAPMTTVFIPCADTALSVAWREV